MSLKKPLFFRIFSTHYEKLKKGIPFLQKRFSHPDFSSTKASPKHDQSMTEAYQPVSNPIPTPYQLRYNPVPITPMAQIATKHDLGSFTIEITNLKIGDSLPAMDSRPDYFDELK